MTITVDELRSDDAESTMDTIIVASTDTHFHRTGAEPHDVAASDRELIRHLERI